MLGEKRVQTLLFWRVNFFIHLITKELSKWNIVTGYHFRVIFYPDGIFPLLVWSNNEKNLPANIEYINKGTLPAELLKN